MSLTSEDLRQIRSLFEEYVEPLSGELEALRNDIKEIYDMIAELQKLERQVAHFEKYNLEQKVIKAYKDILAIAKQENITLPN